MRNRRKHVQYLSLQMALAGTQSASETVHKTLPGKDALAAGQLRNIGHLRMMDVFSQAEFETSIFPNEILSKNGIGRSKKPLFDSVKTVKLKSNKIFIFVIT